MAEEIRHDVVTQAPLSRLAATLDHAHPPWRADEMPPLGHWLFTLPDARQAMLGADGHPQKSGFIPDVGLPRRMWAGSRLTFFDALRIGDTIERHSSVTSVAAKSSMTFVTVRHEIAARGSVAIVEEQDLVYLPARMEKETTVARPVEVSEPASSRSMIADETMLLRFSALTFNAHRIHYDLPYATGNERYPGLVVQGPLLAMLLMDHALREQPGARVAAFEFRARSPVICREPFDLCRAGEDLWVRSAEGAVAMTARIGFA